MFSKTLVFLFALHLGNLVCTQKAKDGREILSCDPDVNVSLGMQVVKEYKQGKFSVWCNPGDGYESIVLRVMGNKRAFHRLNFTKDTLGISNRSLWYHIRVEIYYSYHFISTTYYWYLDVSVNGHRNVRAAFIDWGYINEYLKSVKITAYGPSKWRFTKPDESCIAYNYSTEVRNVTTTKATLACQTRRSETSIAWTVGVCLIFIMVIFDASREISYWFPNLCAGRCIFPCLKRATDTDPFHPNVLVL